MKSRPSLIVFGLVAAAVAASAQPLLSDTQGRRAWEFGLFGGASLSQIKGSTPYADQWGDYLQLGTVKEGTNIATGVKTGWAVGGFVTYYLSRDFGFQAMVGYGTNDVPTTATGAFSWSWNDGTSYSKSATWGGSGSYRAIPVSFDAVIRFGDGGFQAYASAGPTLFLTSFKADSWFGYGITKIQQVSDTQYMQYLDFLKVGLTIPDGTMKKRLTGANLGAGVTFKLSDALGVRLDARFYYAADQVLTWNFVTGAYDGIFYGIIKGESFGAADVSLLRQTSNTFTLKINPSFFTASIGFVFAFGGGR